MSSMLAKALVALALILNFGRHLPSALNLVALSSCCAGHAVRRRHTFGRRHAHGDVREGDGGPGRTDPQAGGHLGHNRLLHLGLLLLRGAPRHRRQAEERHHPLLEVPHQPQKLSLPSSHGTEQVVPCPTPALPIKPCRPQIITITIEQFAQLIPSALSFSGLIRRHSSPIKLSPSFLRFPLSFSPSCRVFRLPSDRPRRLKGLT